MMSRIVVISRCGDFFHPEKKIDGKCDRFFSVTAIHKKPLVTLFGRGGGGMWVLFDGEARELRVPIYRIIREDI